MEFHKPIAIGEGITATFYRAGHIGASSILIEAQSRSIIFSGDVGRFNDPIMRPPESLPNADYLVMESTYGDRLHEDKGLEEKLAATINETVKKRGTIVIPSFAVGRSQQVLFILNKLKKAKKIPALPTYLDSPMAINATDLYCQYHDMHRLTAEMCAEMCADVIITKSSEESKAINEVKDPKIIISASGMASGGRIVHHLAHYIGGPENVIIFVGYQAAGTRGRALLEGAEKIKMFGEEFNVKAKIEYIPGLSAHGDYAELIKWLQQSKLRNPKVYLTHGEHEAAESFRDRLIETFKWDVTVPEDGDEIKL